MKPRSELSMELYGILVERGYPREFAREITLNLNTDFTAKRMIGYLRHYRKPALEDLVDEMLAILSDRNRIIAKKEMERTNAAWNEIMREGFAEDE